MPPPGLSSRWSSCLDTVAESTCEWFFFFFFDFLYMPPPGFSLRAICKDFVVVDEFNSDVSPRVVELVAWAGSDRITRPAAPRSALRTIDFMNEPHWVGGLIVLRHRSKAIPLKMN